MPYLCSEDQIYYIKLDACNAAIELRSPQFVPPL